MLSCQNTNGNLDGVEYQPTIPKENEHEIINAAAERSRRPQSEGDDEDELDQVLKIPMKR